MLVELSNNRLCDLSSLEGLFPASSGAVGVQPIELKTIIIHNRGLKLKENSRYSDTHRYVTYYFIINVPTRGLVAFEAKTSFVLWLAKFKYQKTCL